LFLLIAALSRMLPFSMPQYFAGFVGASNALLALAVFWMVLAGDGRRHSSTPLLAALAGLGFAFSGLAITIARYPHFELLIAVFFLLFATALACRHTRFAAAFFVCGLLVREDAGLHYLAVLGLLIALNVSRGVTLREQRVVLCFAAAGLLYALAVMAAQRLVFPHHASSFALVYLGDPPLAHLTAAHVGQRLLYVLVNRPYILLPACATWAWAWLARSPFVAIGYVACLPWLGLQLLAASPFAAGLASYCAFPCLIGMAWPLVAVLQRRPPSGLVRPLAGFAVLVGLSFVPGYDIHDPGRLPVLAAFLHPSPPLVQQEDIERAVSAVSAARPMLGRLLVDNSVVALAPNGFGPTEFQATPGMGTSPLAVIPDTVVFFADGYDAARLMAIADAAGLMRRYTIPGTPLHLAAHRDLADVPGLSGLIAVE
jgi:hypothetical protein